MPDGAECSFLVVHKVLYCAVVPGLHDCNMQLQVVCCHFVTVAHATTECLYIFLPTAPEISAEAAGTCRQTCTQSTPFQHLKTPRTVCGVQNLPLGGAFLAYTITKVSH